MNVYDTANRLAQEIKESEEYVNYKMAKETLNLKPDLKKKIEEFEAARYDAQVVAMQTGKADEDSGISQLVCKDVESVDKEIEKNTKDIMTI